MTKQLLNPDPSTQWQWHEAFRDMAKNQYRTSYSDMTHFKETYVKTDHPSGYGGHQPSVKHDVLFRNTAFDRKQSIMRADPSRDAHPSFNDQLAGVPTLCTNPTGSKKVPTHGVILQSGHTANPIAPWAVVRPQRPLPCHRRVPETMKKVRSQPQIGGTRNPGAVFPAQMQPSASLTAMPAEAASPANAATSPKSSLNAGTDMRRIVSNANDDANRMPMMSEEDMIRAEMAQGMPQYDFNGDQY